MFSTRLRPRSLSHAVTVLASGVAVVLCASSASAKDSKRAICKAANDLYESAVDKEKDGHLREAGTLASQCAEATECGVIVSRCKALTEKLAIETPTVVPLCSDEKGQPKVDVEVKVDGEVLTSQLDGRALPLEVGLHDITFGTDGKVIATQKVMILEGQRNRPLTAKLSASGTATLDTGDGKSGAPDTSDDTEAKPGRDNAGADALSTPPEQVSRPHSALPFVIGGAGLVVAAAGGLLTYWGSQDNSDLQKMCKPNCSPASVDHVQTMYIAADISFGVGAAALAAATWMLVKPHGEDKPSPSAKVEVHPTASGAFASVSGSF